jgi:hypothetical protein
VGLSFDGNSRYPRDVRWKRIGRGLERLKLADAVVAVSPDGAEPQVACAKTEARREARAQTRVRSRSALPGYVERGAVERRVDLVVVIVVRLDPEGVDGPLGAEVEDDERVLAPEARRDGRVPEAALLCGPPIVDAFGAVDVLRGDDGRVLGQVARPRPRAPREEENGEHEARDDERKRRSHARLLSRLRSGRIVA